MAVATPVGTDTSVLVGPVLSPMTCIVFPQRCAGIVLFSVAGGALESLYV